MLFPQQMSGFEIQRFCPAIPLQTGISADCFYFYTLWLKRAHRREAAFQVPSISLTNDYLFVCSMSVKFSSLSPQIWIPLHFFAALVFFPLCSVTLSRSPPSWCHPLQCRGRIGCFVGALEACETFVFQTRDCVSSWSVIGQHLSLVDFILVRGLCYSLSRIEQMIEICSLQI